MNTQDVIYSKIIEIMLEKSIEFFSKLFSKPKSDLAEPCANLKTGLSVHVNKSYLFSQNISLYKHSDSLDLKNNSIPLKIGNQDRRFYSLNLKKTLDETEILSDNNHHILLGDPGAGKTTTLKRLVSKSYEMLFSEPSESCPYSFPIVVRLSEIQASETLLVHLCHQLGIGYETIRKETSFIETKEIDEEFYDTKRKETFTRKKPVDVKKTRITYEYKIGTYPLKYAIGEYLNDMNCIIFLDGLDEINYQIKDAVFAEIKEISNVIRKSKIVLTSRYLQEIPSFKQFNINEINPLNDKQKKEIAKFWITDIDTFFTKLKKLPYQDISDRPLFLTYLLRLFKANNDELPEQAVDVYRQIILLAIREWDYDKEQDIRRYSKYQTFNTYKKEDFLSELAFELTFTQNVKKIFSRKQLTDAYLNIYRGYPELGIEDKTDILRDIESHNGLIIESTGENFEFSHLSLQEYLCAKYILSIPISRKHIELLNTSPAPLAIANVLSSKPEEWFAILFLNNIGEVRNSYQLNEDKLFEFIDRLLIEKIVFTKPIEELGLATLYLFLKFGNSKIINKLIEFSKTNYIYESVQKCLYLYKIEIVDNECTFTLKKNLNSDFPIKCIEKGAIELKNIRRLIS